MSFQTCMTFFLLWSIEEDILRNVPVFFSHTMEVNGHCYVWTSTFFKISKYEGIFIFAWTIPLTYYIKTKSQQSFINFLYISDTFLWKFVNILHFGKLVANSYEFVRSYSYVFLQ